MELHTHVTRKHENAPDGGAGAQLLVVLGLGGAEDVRPCIYLYFVYFYLFRWVGSGQWCWGFLSIGGTHGFCSKGRGCPIRQDACVRTRGAYTTSPNDTNPWCAPPTSPPPAAGPPPVTHTQTAPAGGHESSPIPPKSHCRSNPPVVCPPDFSASSRRSTPSRCAHPSCVHPCMRFID